MASLDAMPDAGERDLEEALKQCDADIQRQPGFAPAHYQRATVLQSLQRFDEALQSYDRSLTLDPGLAEAHYQRANLLGTLQRFDQAVAGYDRAVRAKPDFAAAWTNRARALRTLRRLEESLRSCDMAIRLQPDNHEPHLVRGNVLMELDRPDAAIPSYERAIAIKADLAEAHYNRANAAASLGRQQDAVRGYDRAIAIRPGFAAAHHGRANALAKLGRSHEAIEGFDRAFTLKPDLAEACNNKGNILCRLGRYAEAVDSYSLAVQARPAYALAWNNMGRALEDLGRVEEALECSDKAIELAPNFAAAHRNKMTTTLLMGDFEEGWRLYERRNVGAPTASQSVSIWSGEESLEGKTLLVVAEQGFGDTLQFCRYARLAAARGARVTLAVQDALVSLLKCLEPEINVTGVSVIRSGFDYYIPLLSMPQAFRTRGDNIPSTVPYIRAEPGRIAQWKARLGKNGFRIGICWQGAPGGEVDVGRSFPVALFEPLGKASGVRLISLQKNAGVEQLRDLPAGMNVETFADAFDPGPDAFVDTAAIMESLDLVITSDTAIAHLSGALGRPTWVALSHVPDWRWLLDRSDTPWYPTMRLFRQNERGDWPGVFAALKTNLLELLAARGEVGDDASR